LKQEIKNTELTPRDFEWHLESSGASEAQTLYVHLANGSCLLLQLVYSTIG